MLSEKGIVLKKQLLLIILCNPFLITTPTMLLPFATLTPPPPLYLFHLMLIVGSLLL
jgi:hypothetical protein